MTNLELLEMAAKAASINLEWHLGSPVEVFPVWSGSPCEPPESDYRNWDPLTDDGDALRLAMALGIDIVWCSSGRVITIASVGDVAIEVVESSRENREENTRRAITRAASEVGRAMP